MRRRLSRLVNLDPYPGTLERRQAVVAYVVTGAAMLGVILGTTLDPHFWVWPLPSWALAALVASGALAVVWVAVYQGRFTRARWVLLAVAWLGSFVPWLGSGWTPAPVLLMIAFMLLAGVMVGPRGVLAAMLLDLVAIGVMHLAAYLALSAETFGNMLADTITVVSFGGIVGVVIYFLAEGWRRGLGYLGEQAAQRRLRLAELSAEISQRIFQRLDLDTLLDDTVTLVRDRFPQVYHAQIFLIDSTGGQAILRASTGPVGAELIRRGHRLAVGSQSVIGQVTARGEAVLARDTSTDPVHRRNELLPDTRTELALPLISGERVIGALDVQSTRPDAFSQDDVDVLQTLANQVAVAIDNAQLFARQQASLADNQRLAAQAQAQLARIQELNRRLTGQVWTEYLEAETLVPALTVDFASGEMTPNAEWTPGLAGAVRGGAVVSGTSGEQGGDRRAVAVPIKVRGQVIGAMEFELDAGADLTPDQTALVESVAERLALAIENARLYSDVQKSAQREAIINEISARLQRVVGMESTLAAAAQGLRSALDAPRIAIRLGAPPQTDGERPNGQESEP